MIIDSLRAAAKKMMIDFESVTSRITHSGEKGTSREELLVRYLKDYIPKKYEISKGIIMDSSGTQSRQQDFIIYDSFNSPVLLNMDSIKMVPIESVYSVIEIKSTLNKERLKECVKNIKSVRCLPKSPITSHLSLTAGFVFAFTSDTSLKTLLGNLVELNKEIEYCNQISVVCVLDKGIIVNISKSGLNNMVMFPNSESTLAIIKNPTENNLLLFYLILMQYLNEINVSPPNLLKYAEKEDILKISYSIPRKFIPNDSYFDFDGRKVNINNAMPLIDSMPQFRTIMSGKATAEQIMLYLSKNLNKLNQMGEEALGGKNETFEFYGKVYKMDFFKDIIGIFNRAHKGEEVPHDELIMFNKIKEELYNQYRNSFSENGS